MIASLSAVAILKAVPLCYDVRGDGLRMGLISPKLKLDGGENYVQSHVGDFFGH